MDVSEHPRAVDLADPAPLDAEEHPAAAPPPAPPESPQPVLPRAALRLAYIFEFWIVLIAVFTVWSEVGGQGHLDLMAWYIKLACAVAFTWSAVRMTSAAVENPRAWNGRTVKWFFAVVTLSALMAGVTYWYHLHEEPDEPDSDDNSATTVSNDALPPFLRCAAPAQHRSPV